MKIRVRGKNQGVPAPIRKLAAEKYGHLSKYLSTITTVDVELYEDGQPKDGKGHVAKVTVATSGPVFRSKAASTDYQTSIDTTLRRLERQVKEFKRKRSGRPAHSRSRRRGAPADMLNEAKSVEPADED